MQEKLVLSSSSMLGLTRTLTTLLMAGIAMAAYGGTYEVVQVTAMAGTPTRSGDSVSTSGQVAHYNLAMLGETAISPYRSSRSDERLYGAQTVYHLKWTPDPEETSHPGTVLARIRVKRKLKVTANASYDPGGGSVFYHVASMWKANGPELQFQVGAPPNWSGGSWGAQTGTAPDFEAVSDEYLAFAFTQNAQGESVSTEAFPVSIYQKVGITSSTPSSICSATSSATVEFKMVQISTQVLDSSY